MRQLIAFNNITLDGYFTDMHGDMSWAHTTDPEFRAFVENNTRAGGMLLFGRVTYELMAAYWPTPLALQNDPVVAGRINQMPKIVFSRTLHDPSWSNTSALHQDPVAAVRRMKQEPGQGMTILGSGSIVSQLTSARLIDEYQVVVNPVILGRGRTMFHGIESKLALTLTKTRAFANGNVLLCYQPKV